MNESDIINALFELCGAAFTLISVLKLLKDKEVKGVSWLTLGFFTSWGIWNVYFYPANGLYWSFAAGVVLCLTNLLWTGMLIYYSKKK